MAQWCNARLVVLGERQAVRRFARRAARKPLAPPEYVFDAMIIDSEVIVPERPRGRPTDIFTPDMLVGEMQGLIVEQMQSVGGSLAEKKYIFQTRNDDGRDHFRAVSRRYPELTFVLVFDCDVPEYGYFGSYLIRNGRYRSFMVPQETIDSVMNEHCGDIDFEEEEEDYFWAEYDAFGELMDRAEAHWRNRAIKLLRRAE